MGCISCVEALFYGSIIAFDHSFREKQNQTDQTKVLRVTVMEGKGRVPGYLELIYTGHVVAEHAVLQHGDGVALAAHFLDLVTGTVAVRGHTQRTGT